MSPPYVPIPFSSNGEPLTSAGEAAHPFKRIEMLGETFKIHYSKAGTSLLFMMV
jgi:hypothetical protein